MQPGSNCLRNAGGTPLAAASSWFTNVFCDVFVERKALAVRVALKDLI